MALPDDVLDKITEATIQRSKRLAKSMKKEIEGELNNVIYAQLSKVELKYQFLKKFWGVFDLARSDLQMVRGECLAERVALSALKSGKVDKELEQKLWQNQFAS